MTAVIDDTDTTQTIEESPATTSTLPAPWSARAGAFVVDVLPGCAVALTMALVALTVPLRGIWWWSGVAVGGLALMLTAGNRILLPAITGWSLGRAVFGIAVQRPDGTPVGPYRLLIRELAHLLDTAALFVGWLWPLWDQRRRTFADMLVHTEVRQARLPRLPQQVPLVAAVVFLAATLPCIAGAAVSYLVVYQHDRGTDQARAEIAVQGPKIIAQMLSYQPESLQDDFARARSLVTDKYREQLVAQQQVAQQAKPVTNEYSVVNYAVLSAAPHRTTMLLFLQGRRGAEGKDRLISATVRVVFAQSVTGQWLVDDLTVVTKPLPAEDGN